MATMNDYDDLHDEDYDEDDEDHEVDSDIALDCFTDRAMRHGRRAATWLLFGALAELGVCCGGSFVISTVPAKGLPLYLVILLLLSVTVAVMLAIFIAVYKRWERHRDRVESVVEEAMVWRSDVQRKREDDESAYMRCRLDRIDEERIDALLDEMTWNVGPAPAFIAADDHKAIAAYEQQKEDEQCMADDGEFDTDYREQPAAELSGEDSTPAVRAWIERWARLKPVKQRRPQQLEQRHNDAEGRPVERELCRAINKHWTGAFHKLLDEGVDPNGHNGSGKPLGIAVLRGRLEYVSWLLTLGADPNAQYHGRTIISTLMRQVEQYADEGGGEGDDYEWPERIELLARWGANPHLENRWYDEDDDDEGPTAWPFIVKRPVLYEAYMKGVAARQQAEDDARAMLGEACEAGQRAKVADATESMLAQFRCPR
ncbi:hypothetical protein [Paraburkholderia tropica]|uniref:hypothetical protein n=1 Tax=Paraburkholderia tropica TaxID=92647 RepID=UPI0031D33B60